MANAYFVRDPRVPAFESDNIEQQLALERSETHKLIVQNTMLINTMLEVVQYCNRNSSVDTKKVKSLIEVGLKKLESHVKK